MSINGDWEDIGTGQTTGMLVMGVIRELEFLRTTQPSGARWCCTSLPTGEGGS